MPIAWGESFLQSRISIDDLVLYGSFATFRWKETKWDWDWRLRLNDIPNAIGCTCVCKHDLSWMKGKRYADTSTTHDLHDKWFQIIWKHMHYTWMTNHMQTHERRLIYLTNGSNDLHDKWFQIKCIKKHHTWITHHMGWLRFVGSWKL